VNKEMQRLAVAVAYAKRAGFSEPPPPNPDGSVPYEALAEWFDRVCRFAADDLSEHADRFALASKEIEDMPEAERMRAAIYARMSTDKQADTSPEDQA